MEYFSNNDNGNSEFYQNELYCMVYSLQREVEKLKNELIEERKLRTMAFKDVLSNLNLLKEENQILRDSLDIQESKLRKNNIVIFGVDEPRQNTENTDVTVQEILKNIKVDVGPSCIMESFRIGQNKGQRPILCKVSSFGKKMEIMKKNKTGGQYAILNDLTRKERRDKKELKCYIDAAKSRGHKVNIRYGKVYINGVLYTKEELKNIGNAAPNPDSEGGRRHSPPQQASKTALSVTASNVAAVDNMAPTSTRALKSPLVTSRQPAKQQPTTAPLPPKQPLQASTLKKTGGGLLTREKSSTSPTTSDHVLSPRAPHLQAPVKKSAVTRPPFTLATRRITNKK